MLLSNNRGFVLCRICCYCGLRNGPDYSIAKVGSLVAYRWNGEEEFNNDYSVNVKDKEQILLSIRHHET